MPACTYGPERAVLARLTEASMRGSAIDVDTIADELNPDEERCGAMIRADAYGYACPGRPELAAELAWRDAGLTHRRTGIYGTMFAAAAIATAFVERDPLALIATAARYVPQRSRFRESVADRSRRRGATRPTGSTATGGSTPGSAPSATATSTRRSPRSSTRCAGRSRSATASACR